MFLSDLFLLLLLSCQGGQKQQFFLGHSDMVSCLAVHRTEDPNFLAAASGATGQRKGAASTIVCSGEFGARPRVCVWCAETCEVRNGREQQQIATNIHVCGNGNSHLR